MQKSEKFKEIIRAAKFTLISISAGLIQIGVFTLMYELGGLPYWLSYLVSLLLSIIWNFTINRKVTFKAANNVPKAMAQLLCFYAVFTPVTVWGGQWIEGLGVHGLVVEAVTMILNFVLEFLFCRFVIYRDSCDTATVDDRAVNNEQDSSDA
ncbi:MAG: GtrA family protein [Clostridia bacterium]|nr:GtrA family protein [Clostridia bacterium]